MKMRKCLNQGMFCIQTVIDTGSMGPMRFLFAPVNDVFASRQRRKPSNLRLRRRFNFVAKKNLLKGMTSLLAGFCR